MHSLIKREPEVKPFISVAF